MAIFIGGKKVQETGGKYVKEGIPASSSTQPHHTTRERFGSPHSEKGFQWKNVPIKGGKPAHTPAEQFENLRLRKNELQHIPYSGDDSGRNMYQMGIQNLLERGDPYKKAYLQKYPIGGRINLGVPAAFNALTARLPGLSIISSMFGNMGSNVKKGLQSAFDAPMKDLGFHKNKFMQDLSQAPSGFFNNLQSMLGINQNPNLADVKTTQTTEDIVSPVALSRTNQVPPIAPQFLDLFSEQEPFYGGRSPSDELYSQYFTMNPSVKGSSPVSRQYKDMQLANRLNINPTPINYAHGGDIQSDAYAKLKAINDSMHEM